MVKSKALWINYGEGEEVIDGKKTTVKHPGVIWLRFSYSEDEPWRKVNITKRASDIPTLRKKYPAGNPIKALKLGDLRKMIPYLPPQYVPFYDGLTAATSHGSDSKAAKCCVEVPVVVCVCCVFEQHIVSVQLATSLLL